jgi:hemerythrin-like domain-containing protein
MSRSGRRNFLAGGAGGAVALIAGCAGRQKTADSAGAADILPPEDLMREHGVLRRLLLVYEECLRRLDAGERAVVPVVLPAAAAVVRRFIEDYHEKLEEDFLFPRFEKAGQLRDLVAVLRRQHDAGRRITAEVEAEGARVGEAAVAARIGPRLRQFARMYRPHAAREDTVLFPALRRIVSPAELAALGDTFEDQERALFGESGFERVVAEVARLEEQLGIADLAELTPG